MNRPIGVYLIALLTMLRGLWSIVVGVMLLFFGGMSFIGGYWDQMATSTFFAVFDLVIGILISVVALGLFRFQSWAVMLAILAVGLGLIFDFFTFFSSGSINWISVILGIIVLVYLLLPGTRAAFQE
jgi:hypothetical protein